ncbi:hypothetical protein [uncultured Flavobacterium sp.]|uniref:hypothetical protein n=1 Tax=uncultured Flavobacterium sp. TaxID=165435 RepID=UPI00259301A8|nr:hypothetical protein [uncultured Flavobacterium sp.]
MSDRTKPKRGTSNAAAQARRRLEAENRAKNKATTSTPEAQNSQAIADLVGRHDAGASGLVDRFFAPRSMGRVDESRSGEITGILDQLSAVRDTYGIPGKNRSAELSANLSSLKSQAEGYTSEEYQGLREQQRRGTESAYNTQNAAANRSIVRNRLTGSQAALMKDKAQRDRAEAQGRNEQDLMIRGADEKYRRTGEYGSTLRGVEDTEYNRMRETSSDYADRLGVARDDELKRRLINLDQVNAEKAGQAGTYFGAINLGETRDTNKRNEKLSRDIYGLTKPKKSKGRGDGRDRSTNTQTSQTTPSGGFDFNTYFDRAKDIVGGGQ